MQDTKLAKNRAGYWEIRWTEDRVSRTVSCRTKNKQEAEAFRRAFIAAEMTDRKHVTGHTIRDLLDAYLKVKPQQRFNLAAALRLYADSMVEDLDEEWSSEYRRKRLAEGVKDGTIRRELGAVQAAIGRAVRFRKLKAEDRPIIELPPEGQARTFVLNEAEADDLWNRALALAEGKTRLPRITRFVCLALETAARKEAIETLTWDRVDLDKGLIDFRDVTRAVSRKRRSHVRISSKLRGVLERSKLEATSNYVLDSPGNVRASWETFVATTPWKDDLHIHALRKTWATNAARRGVSLWDIANVLGDTLETVTKHYAIYSPDHLKGVFE
jgi:integrase